MKLIVEPHLIALGPSHVATAMNDRVWVYEIGSNGKLPINFTTKSLSYSCMLFDTTVGPMYEKSYLGTVSDMKLNLSFLAVLFDSKIHLHLV